MHVFYDKRYIYIYTYMIILEKVMWIKKKKKYNN